MKSMTALQSIVIFKFSATNLTIWNGLIDLRLDRLFDRWIALSYIFVIVLTKALVAHL